MAGNDYLNMMLQAQTASDVQRNKDTAEAYRQIFQNSGNNMRDPQGGNATLGQIAGDDQPKVTPVNRMMRDVQAMASHPDAAVRKQGESLMAEMYKQSTKVAADSRTTDVKNFEYMQKDTGGEFAKYLASRKPDMYAKARVKHGQRFRDKYGNEVRIPANTLSSVVEEMGLYAYDAPSGESSSKAVMSMLAAKDATAVRDNMYLPSKVKGQRGKIDQRVIRAMAGLDETGQAIGSLGTKIIYGREVLVKAQKTYQAFDRISQGITRFETGAAMNPSEIENTKQRFVPRPFDTPEAQQMKVDAMNFFIDNMNKIMDPKNFSKGMSGEEIGERIYNMSINAISNSETDKEAGVGAVTKKTSDINW